MLSCSFTTKTIEPNKKLSKWTAKPPVPRWKRFLFSRTLVRENLADYRPFSLPLSSSVADRRVSLLPTRWGSSSVSSPSRRSAFKKKWGKLVLVIIEIHRRCERVLVVKGAQIVFDHVSSLVCVFFAFDVVRRASVSALVFHTKYVVCRNPYPKNKRKEYEKVYLWNVFKLQSRVWLMRLRVYGCAWKCAEVLASFFTCACSRRIFVFVCEFGRRKSK